MLGQSGQYRTGIWGYPYLVAHAGRDGGGGGGGCVVKPVASHIAPARRCQAPYIVGLPLPSLTRFKPVRPA